MRLRNLIYYQLGLLCLAGKLFCQEPAFAYLSKTRTIFEVTDSLVLEAGSDCAGNSYSPYFLDSIFYFKSIHTGEIYYYNYKGLLQGKLQLNFRDISIGQAQDLPVLSGNCACVRYRYPSCRSLSDIMIQKNYILAYSDHFWATYNKNGDRINYGFWKMPCPSSTECYAGQPLYEGGIIYYKGKTYYVTSLERIWPQSWNCEDSTSNYPFEYDSAYYAPNNYLFAYYPIPLTITDSCAWKETNFYGIEPELLGGRLARFYGSALGAGRHLIAQYLFTDSIRKRIYIAMKTEDSVRVYDYSGSLIRKIGGRGKFLTDADTLLAAPPAIKTINQSNWQKVISQNEQALEHCFLGTYSYNMAYLDPKGGHLLRYYRFPYNGLQPKANTKLQLAPPNPNRCLAFEQALQIIDVNTGNIIYDELVSRPFKIIGINAPGNYWIFGYYMGDMTKAKLYRVKMAVKEEE